MERVNNPAKFRRRLIKLGVNLIVGAVLVSVLVQLFFAHRRVEQQEQLDVQQEMRRWLMTHPPQASFAPLAEWETPWERVLFDHGNPYFDPLGGRLDDKLWEITPVSPKAGPRAVLPLATQPDTLRELRLTWRGQPLLPEFEVQFLLFAEPSKCRLALELTPDNPDFAPISFHYVVTHAGFFAESNMAREEGEFIEHGVRLIWLGDELKVVANNTQVEALGRLPAEWNATPWFLTLRLETFEDGEVSMRYLLLFRPVAEEENEAQ